jgi:hypothetical protein
MWISADASSGGDGLPTEGVLDLTSYANNVQQLTVAKQPIYYANQVNGKPAWFFDGVDDWWPLQNPAYGFSSNDITCFVVLSPLSLAYAMALTLDFQLSELRQDGDGLRCQWLGPDGGSDATTAVYSSGWQLWMSKSNYSGVNSIQTRINAGGLYTTLGVATPTTVGNLSIGARVDGSYSWSGYIAEVLVFDEALSLADEITVRNYLMSKYNL